MATKSGTSADLGMVDAVIATEATAVAGTPPNEPEASDSDGGSGSQGAAKEKPEAPGLGLQNELVRDFVPSKMRRGVLIPLKTTLEVRQDHTLVQAYITRAPNKAANDIVTTMRSLLPDGNAKSLPHLRRCAKPSDLPAHLKTQFMNDNAVGRQVHTGKSNWLYILCGEVTLFNAIEDLVKLLASVEGNDEGIFVATIPVPLVAPTCQIQAAMWTSQFWPTVYRKNNPLGPHPSMIARNTDEIKDDASVWMALAHRVAVEAKAAGIGEPIGAVIVQRDRGKVDIVSIAGDARWHQETDRSGAGNPMGHASLRAISQVAQKLVRHERVQAGKIAQPPILEYDSFQDGPLLESEKSIFEEEHPTSDGYLCHGLELYLTHEPCVQCSMGILHSRMGKVVFCHRMPLTGGLCSEDRGHGQPEMADCGGGRGLGLFWRRELNWSMLAWEWEPADSVDSLPSLPAKLHV